MMKKYMIIVSLLMAWTTSLLAENSTLPLTVIPGTDGSVHLVSAVPAEVTGSVISKGFEYRLKGAGAWTTVSAAGAFEADIAVPVGTYEFRVFAEVSGQGMLYSRTNQVMVVGGYDNNAGTPIVTSLANTKWKCEGIVNVETGVLTELETETCSNSRIDCEKECYTLMFDNAVFNPDIPEIIFFGGQAVINRFDVKCKIDYITNNIEIEYLSMTQVGGPLCDEMLYLQLLYKVNKFSLQENKLRLYYDEHNYLLFKPLEP